MLKRAVAHKRVKTAGAVGEGEIRIASGAAGTGVAINTAAAVAVAVGNVLRVSVAVAAAAVVHGVVMAACVAGTKTSAAWGRGAALVLGH